MNTKRIVLGGFAAGLLFNVFGIASALVFDVAEAFSHTGWQPAPWTGLLHLAMRFALGFAAVFLYAAIRPRFGPGIKSAFVVGCILWFVGYAMPGILLTEIGVLDVQRYVGLTIWGFVEAPLATSVGAWLYKEDAAATV